MDLTEFIAARLDEDEAVAREAASALPGDEGYGWSAVHRYLETHPASGESFIVDTSSELVARPASARSYDRAVADHIARHDPARVLRDVAAKRAILADCARAVSTQREFNADHARHGSPFPAPHANLAFRTVLSLASAWSEHPGYEAATRQARSAH